MNTSIKKNNRFFEIKYALFLILIFLGFNTQIFSQTSTDTVRHELWFNLDAGMALGDRYLNIMVGKLSVSYQLNDFLFLSTRAVIGGDRFYHQDSTMRITGTTVKDLGLLLGLFSNRKDFKISISTGLSYFHGRYIGENYFNTLNIPVEAGAYYFHKHYGIGMRVFDNLNSKMNYYGIEIGGIIVFY